MAGNIVNQKNKTALNQVQDPTLSAKIIQPVPYIPSFSSLAPVSKPSYADVVFKDSLATPNITTLASPNYTVLTYGKTPGNIGEANGPSPALISYFDIEDNSTYFEEVDGDTYYVVE